MKVLVFLFACISPLWAYSQNTKSYQFLYSEGEITCNNKKLVPTIFYEVNTEVSFKGKIAIFYDTTNAYLYYMRGELNGKLNKLCVPVAHARGDCYDCESPLLDFANVRAPYLLMYPDLILSTKKIQDREESNNRIEIQNQLLIVSLFQNKQLKTKRILARKLTYIEFNIGEASQKYKFDSIVIYKAPESFLQDKDLNKCELINRRQVIWADTALLKKQIAPFVRDLQKRRLLFNNFERTRYRLALYDFIALVQGGVPDSNALERWLKKEFDFEIK